MIRVIFIGNISPFLTIIISNGLTGAIRRNNNDNINNNEQKREREQETGGTQDICSHCISMENPSATMHMALLKQTIAI